MKSKCSQCNSWSAYRLKICQSCLDILGFGTFNTLQFLDFETLLFKSLLKDFVVMLNFLDINDQGGYEILEMVHQMRRDLARLQFLIQRKYFVSARNKILPNTVVWSKFCAVIFWSEKMVEKAEEFTFIVQSLLRSSLVPLLLSERKTILLFT